MKYDYVPTSIPLDNYHHPSPHSEKPIPLSDENKKDKQNSKLTSLIWED
ncbi:hypothetical protein HYT25_01355 [Candidatus Pacearchaeota archaeon]|nr:hypothetical protein [Candidatus Pacearchaeota archaeon]